jgi:16S rRNA (uracil1498-N3)-methyltransferase
MRQFLLPATFGGEPRIVLSDGDFRYLCRVLRLKEGARLPARDSHGRMWTLELESIGRDSCTCRLDAVDHGSVSVGEKPEAVLPDIRGGREEAAGSPRADPCPLVLYQGLPKGQKMDLIVRQATEAGVSMIVPLRCEFSVSRIDRDEGGAKRGRWERVVREAMQQSGSSVATEVAEPIDIEEAAAHWRSLTGYPSGDFPASRAFLFHQEPLARSSLHRYLYENPVRVAVAVGPEGGFSEREVESLTDSGFLPVFLGANVLRAETAALYAIAAIRIILLEKHSWTTTSIEK